MMLQWPSLNNRTHVIEWTNGGRVSPKRFVGEGIHSEYGDLHSGWILQNKTKTHATFALLHCSISNIAVHCFRQTSRGRLDVQWWKLCFVCKRKTRRGKLRSFARFGNFPVFQRVKVQTVSVPRGRGELCAWARACLRQSRKDNNWGGAQARVHRCHVECCQIAGGDASVWWPCLWEFASLQLLSSGFSREVTSRVRLICF